MSNIYKRGGTLWVALAIVGLVLTPKFARADTDLKFSSVVKELKVSGDLRLRYDDKIFKVDSAANKPDTPVFRLRLRLAVDFTLPNSVYIHTRFASGTGEQTSTNQTFTNEATQKQFWIDRAYVEWSPGSVMKLFGGKMANPLWAQYTSDAWIDADINPEGSGENFNFLLGNTSLFLNALQSPISQVTVPNNVYLFSEQIGVETKLPFESRVKIGYAYHDWYNINGTTTTGSAIDTTVLAPPSPKRQEGNRRIAGSNALASAYYVNELSAELSSWIASKPLSIQGTFLKNTGAKSINGEKKDTGYQVGTIFGKAKDPHTWELAYFYKYLESDCTVANWADSDFGDGGTNRQGHIMWIAYAPTDWVSFQTKYFQTKQIDPSNSASATTGNGSIDRIQADAIFKF